MLLAVYAFIIGSLIGSFLNVVIFRVPAGRSIVWPRSSCPNCGHTLSPIELIPIVSWTIQGGKCRNCKAPISVRYPLVEALTGVLFLGAALLHPVFPDLLFIWAFIALLIALSFIDIDTYELPWTLNYGGLFLGLLGAGLLGFPRPFAQALDGALMGAGLIALFAGYGGLIYNRLKDGPREGPVGLHTMHFAALVGAWLGPAGGLMAGFLNWALNARSGKVLALHDGLTLGLAILAPIAAIVLPIPLLAEPRGVLGSFRGMLIAIGGVALAGGIYWWIKEYTNKGKPQAEAQPEPGYTTVMGFGDVVLAGFLGAWLGFSNLLVAIFVAVFAGAIIGLIMRRINGEKLIPFGPYLAIGGVIAYFYGQDLVQWYLSYIGVS